MQHSLTKTTIKSVLPLVAAVLLLSACSTTEIIGSWSEPGLTAQGFQNILVIGVAQDNLVKRTFEDIMVARLKEKGIQASPSYRFMTSDEKVDQETILKHLQQNNMDGVMVTMLIDKRTETVVTPAQTSVRTGDYYSYRAGGGYNRWYPNYAASYDVTHTPARVQNFDVLTIETSLYKIQDSQEQLAWSAQSETAPGGDVNSDLSELVDKLIKDMSSQGLF